MGFSAASATNDSSPARFVGSAGDAGVPGLLAHNANACAAHSTAAAAKPPLYQANCSSTYSFSLSSLSVYGRAAFLLSISRHLPLSATTKRLPRDLCGAVVILS